MSIDTDLLRSEATEVAPAVAGAAPPPAGSGPAEKVRIGRHGRILASIAPLARRPGFVVSVVFVGLVIAAAAFPAVFATHDPVTTEAAAKLLPPGPDHWFGTDQLGRDLYSRVIHGTTLSVQAALLAVGIAPLVEELLFRAGLFRWLRTRTSRPASLLLPALIFASLHGSLAALAPLLVLAVILSLAYERSGHVLTPITAHALFNLNTLLIILAGFPA